MLVTKDKDTGAFWEGALPNGAWDLCTPSFKSCPVPLFLLALSELYPFVISG